MLFISLLLPALCYVVSAGIFIFHKNYPDAVMYLSYGAAQCCVIWRIYA